MSSGLHVSPTVDGKWPLCLWKDAFYTSQLSAGKMLVLVKPLDQNKCEFMPVCFILGGG